MKRFSMRVFVLVFVCLTGLAHCRADELAAITGLVTDPGGRSVPGVTILITNLSTNITSRTVTNDQGLYRVPSLQPGIYRMTLDKDGFKSIVKSGVELHVQDVASINFELQVGSVNETVTVEAGALVINTTDASVSTVVDRQFAENLPMNGRSFQTLVQLTPGVVLSTGNGYDQGQFNVNGQRGYSNYWMVDGVSANIGINASSVPEGGAAGALQGFSAQGGTNSLVSVDALQEFRIQTSSYAPEFGRTPGGQISIVTRSGANRFHGTVFDYFRNDVLDANDWFNGYTNHPPIRKAEERQNDFGGTFSGRILKDRTFFFFSYEGLRLRQPQTIILTVPDLAARQNAVPAVQPFLNGFPLPNGPDLGAGEAVFTDSHSNQSTLNATSLRIDHKVSEKLSLFGRYNYSPSEVLSFGGSGAFPYRITIHTATLGTTWTLSPTLLNDFRFNYSRTESVSSSYLDTAGGAVVPPFSSLLPSPFTLQNSEVSFGIFSSGAAIGTGVNSDNVQRQINVVDGISLRRGPHSLKFGVDFRRLTPSFGHPAYVQDNFFNDIPSVETGTLSQFFANVSTNAYLLFRNLGLYAQDTWRISSRLNLTYGLRWDVDFSPSTTRQPGLAAIVACCNFATLALAPAGTPVFATTYGNVAPRMGAAYQVTQRTGWETVLRGGFGVFYDLADQDAASLANYTSYPFGSGLSIFSGNFPLSSSQIVPPPVSPANLSSEALSALDPHLKLPYTLQWNVALEQAIGSERSLSVSYIGAAGRRLTQSQYGPANSSILYASVISNAGTSDYDSLQAQFQQRLSQNLQLLASYTWAHSIDTASASSLGAVSNYYSAQYGANANRGPSDFDIRNSFSAGLTYNIPAPKINALSDVMLRGWSIESIIQARSALPVNVDDQALAYTVSPGNAFADIRPDIASGMPLYLYGSQYPGGKALNPSAFVPPPTDPNTGIPLRQGDLGRNALRGFGATQWDFAVHRTFPVREALKLDFRAEMFNVLNHPNFGPPVGDISQALFGLSTSTLANSLNTTGSSLSPLYQIGGPRSIQFALKLVF